MDKLMQYATSLQRMIQCATISTPEYHDQEFAKLRSVMKDLFPLVHQHATIQIFGNDCWLYTLAGKQDTRSIVLMSHHDVVAATGTWQYPAFSGEIVQDRIWGRGSVDTKTSLFAEFMAIEEVLAEGKQLPCTVYVASSHNEELAGDGIPLVVEYFKEHHITPDFVLDEGGAVIDPPIAGIKEKCAVLAIHEKGRVKVALEAPIDQEHAGLSGSNQTPSMRMAKLMVQLDKHPPYLRKISPELCAMFSALAPHMKFPMRMIFQHTASFSSILKRVIPKLNVQAGAMLGTTGTFQNVSSDETSCQATLLLRPINAQDVESEITQISTMAKKFHITVKVAETELYSPASMEGSAWEQVISCVKNTFPGNIVMPFILPAGTDARHFCSICPHVYRFAPIDIDAQQFQSVHGIDENINIEAIGKAVSFYKSLLTHEAQ